MIRGPETLLPKSALFFILVVLLLCTVAWVAVYLLLLQRGWH